MNAAPQELTRIIQNQLIIRAIQKTCLEEPVQTQKHSDFRYQIWSCFESEYAKAQPETWEGSPQTHRLWRIVRANLL